MKSIKEYGRIMQDAFKQAVWEDFECVSLGNDEYTLEDVIRFNEESNKEIFDLVIDGEADTVEEIGNILFLGGFGMCFEESKEYEDIYKETWGKFA